MSRTTPARTAVGPAGPPTGRTRVPLITMTSAGRKPAVAGADRSVEQ
jgi:hypothetical protein